MKFILKLSLAILVLAPVFWTKTQASSDVILVKQERILKEEYQMVRQMRHRLRYLLEQQDMENTLQEGEDVFQDLQQLEQWLEEMKRNPENANMEALMQMMQQLEQRMNELAERLGVSESRITRLVERMVKKGLVTTHRSTRDRRSWEVGISRQGIDANVNVSAVSSEVQAELMARLPDAEHELIYRNVKTYIETFHQVLENKDAELESSQDPLT